MSVPETLTSTEDAIRLADAVLGPDDLAAIVEGDATKLAMPISGDVPPEGVERIAELLRTAVPAGTGARLVLATRRRTGPPMVLESELDRWRRLLRLHDGHHLRLVEWLVFVRDDVVLSLAELAGPVAVWS